MNLASPSWKNYPDLRGCYSLRPISSLTCYRSQQVILFFFIQCSMYLLNFFILFHGKITIENDLTATVISWTATSHCPKATRWATFITRVHDQHCVRSPRWVGTNCCPCWWVKYWYTVKALSMDTQVMSLTCGHLDKTWFELPA